MLQLGEVSADADGAVGRFHLDPTRADSATGAVVIVVSDASLVRAAPPRGAPGRRPARARDPLKGILPVR